MDNNTSIFDPKLQVLLNNKQDGFKYRERRQADWDENYTLYRDKVTINRLTQRQSIHIPLMKQTIRTLMKDVDDMPLIEFENRDNDKQAEVFQNEYWKYTVEYNKMELKDVVDKKQVFMFGRSFDQMQIIDGKVCMTVEDPEDILISRYTDPTNLDSSRYLIHTHIFKTLSEIERNPDYDKQAIADMKTWYQSKEGIVKSADNMRLLSEKNNKMRTMGVTDIDDPILGETYVELTLHFVYDTKEKGEEEQLFLKVEIDNMKILLSKPLEEVIGKTKDNFWKTHFPYNSWADDIDRQDFWTDGVADMVRPSNKILDAWISQLVENRTLKNLNMNLFDSTVDGFVPQTWQPRAWGMYGIPVPGGKTIKDVFHPLPVADLSESLDEMQFIIGINEKATGATATQQGAQTDRQVTLGEVQLALGEAKARIKGMSKFYTHAWKERAYKFLKLIEAGADRLDAVKIYKKGRNTDAVFSREIKPTDYVTQSGYTVKVWSQDEREEQNTKNIEKMNAVVANIPGNSKLIEIYQRKLLEFAGLSPDEVQAVVDLEIQKRQQADQMMQMQIQSGMMGTVPGGAPMAQPQPQPPAPLPVAQGTA